MSVVYLADLDPAAVRVDRPLWFHLRGLQETQSGYGKRLRSRECVRTSDGRLRRVYVTCYSNAGTAWIRYQGREFVVVDERIRQESSLP